MKTVGILGIGQVGAAFASGLSDQGVEIRGYDNMWNTPPYRDRILERCNQIGLELVASPESLAKNSDIILAATAPSLALQTAESIAPYLHHHHIYVDFNSAIPSVKERVATAVSPASFVDAAILGSLSQYGHQVPVVMSGKNSDWVSAFFRENGMDVTSIGPDIGQASALKIIRSIFTKGMECIVLECLHAAKYYSIDDLMKEAITDFLVNKPIDSTLEMLITTNAIHAERRAGEMEGVKHFLDEINLNSIMSKASNEKLEWSSSLRLKETFNGEIPTSMDDVLREIVERTTERI